jgi:glycosyltransferase involved in cell wall biosynthesis
VHESHFRFLKQQDLQNFDLLFVDDYSTDGTISLLQMLLKGMSLTYHILKKNKNEGAGKARDFALDSGLIRTNYVLFLDPDDEPLPDFLSTLMQKAEETNADITMCGYERRLRSNGHLISTEMVNNPSMIKNLDQCPIIPYLNPAPWNKLFRVSVIKDARFINRGGGEDEMFFLKVLPRSQTISFVNRVLYRYYVHDNSLISSTSYELLLDTRRGYSEVKEFYNSHGETFHKFYGILEAAVFVRFGIGATTRFCLAFPKDAHAVLKENKAFFKKYFPTWFSNRNLSFAASFKGGLKALMVWRCKWLFKIGFFRIFLFDYQAFTKVFKKDVKW